MTEIIESASFAGHETFPFRFGWLPRAVAQVEADTAVFGQEDAIVRFGVGKNMVRSIRHWGLATGVLEEVEKTRGKYLGVSDLGKYLFHPKRGVDRYLEDPGTTWLLHWELASRPVHATTWYWVFNHAPQLEFSRGDLVAWLLALAEQKGWTRVAEVSLKRDVDTFVRTYVPSKLSRSVGVEDSIDCPLVELGLLRENAAPQGTYSLVRGRHSALPDELFAYALVRQLRALPEGSRTVPMHSVAFAPGSPGRVFCLSEDAVLARLERIGRLTNNRVVFDETAGLKQLLLKSLPNPQDLLKAYYRAGRSDA